MLWRTGFDVRLLFLLIPLLIASLCSAHRYGRPRAATIIALTDGMLWAIDRFVFVNSLMRTQALRKEILRTLRQVKAFHALSVSQLQRLVDLMHEGSFVDGEVIIKQGDEGKQFYIIVEGSCRLSQIDDTESGQETEIGVLNENDYFGEVSLLSSEPSRFTVTTLTYVEVLVVSLLLHSPASVSLFLSSLSLSISLSTPSLRSLS
jgi:CRP-like cAMP-binding protein